MLRAGQCCQSRLSARMVQFVHAVLRNALECAVREEVIPRNAARLVKVATPQYAVNRGLTAPQAQAVLKAARTHRLSALYMLALYLGLRHGELLGLRWETSISTAASSKSCRPSSGRRGVAPRAA